LNRSVEGEEGDVDYKKFYAQLFAPLEASLGPVDAEGIFHIMGFDGGGPLNFSTIGRGRGEPFTTYVSCELAVRKEQKPSTMGRYEYCAVAITSNGLRKFCRTWAGCPCKQLSGTGTRLISVSVPGATDRFKVYALNMNAARKLTVRRTASTE
jgi:hypothetical protein